MSRKRRVLIGLLCGALAVILILFLSLPYVFRAIGRAEISELKELGLEYEELLEEEFRYLGSAVPTHVSERKKALDGRIEGCRHGIVNAFSIAKRLNRSLLNDEDLLWLANARWWLIERADPSPYSDSELQRLYSSIRSDLEDALRLNPKNKKAYSWLLASYSDMYLRDKAKAREIGERFRKAFPDDPDMLYALYSYGLLGGQDNESKKELLLDIIERDPTHWANISLAGKLKDELDFDGAIAVLEKWMENKPEHYLIRRAERQLRNVKDYKEEIGKNEAILAENPNDYVAVKALADIYSIYLFHDERALHYLERAYELDPKDEDVMDWLSYYRQKSGDTEGARELYKKLHWGDEE